MGTFSGLFIFFPIKFNKISKVVITVRVVYGEVAAAKLGVLGMGGGHGFLFFGGVELVARFDSFIILAVLFRLENKRSLEVAIFLNLASFKDTLS